MEFVLHGSFLRAISRNYEKLRRVSEVEIRKDAVMHRFRENRNQKIQINQETWAFKTIYRLIHIIKCTLFYFYFYFLTYKTEIEMKNLPLTNVQSWSNIIKSNYY